MENGLNEARLQTDKRLMQWSREREQESHLDQSEKEKPVWKMLFGRKNCHEGFGWVRGFRFRTPCLPEETGERSGDIFGTSEPRCQSGFMAGNGEFSLRHKSSRCPSLKARPQTWSSWVWIQARTLSICVILSKLFKFFVLQFPLWNGNKIPICRIVVMIRLRKCKLDTSRSAGYRVSAMISASHYYYYWCCCYCFVTSKWRCLEGTFIFSFKDWKEISYKYIYY